MIGLEKTNQYTLEQLFAELSVEDMGSFVAESKCVGHIAKWHPRLTEILRDKEAGLLQPEPGETVEPFPVLNMDPNPQEGMAAAGVADPNDNVAP